MWWLCIEAKRYWTKIHTWLEKMIEQHINLRPEIFLVGIIPETYVSLHTSKDKKYLIIHVVTAAKIVFAQNWKNEKIPTEEDIIRKVLECAEMTRLTLAIKQKEQTGYYQIWECFYQWLEKKYES
uniref:Uncharacterized protein n=1 Tax=Micrurus spixii TaxID=129469 RepID=A0A2D4LG50_9SAUR